MAKKRTLGEDNISTTTNQPTNQPPPPLLFPGSEPGFASSGLKSSSALAWPQHATCTPVTWWRAPRHQHGQPWPAVRRSTLVQATSSLSHASKAQPCQRRSPRQHAGQALCLVAVTQPALQHLVLDAGGGIATTSCRQCRACWHPRAVGVCVAVASVQRVSSVQHRAPAWGVTRWLPPRPRGCMAWPTLCQTHSSRTSPLHCTTCFAHR